MGMSDRREPEETVTFSRRNELPGVEIRTVSNTRRTWSCYSADFEFIVPTSWCGEIRYRDRSVIIEPGTVFCAYPGEVFSARRVLRGGSARAVTIEPKVLYEAIAEHGLSPSDLELPTCVKLSAGVQTALLTLFDVIGPEATPLRLETVFHEFVDVMVRELVGHARTGAQVGKGAGDDRASEYVRRRLEEDADAKVDLTLLARETNLSRFQAIRAFKQRYGLPPHTYQLRVRLALAKQSLRAGVAPAQVAADYGFVDQSHLSRHFKRLTGITPVQYARIGSEASRELASRFAPRSRLG